MDDSTIPEGSEASSPASDFSFGTPGMNGTDLTTGNFSAEDAEEQLQAGVTGAVPPTEVNNPAGIGELQSLQEQGINLTGPVEVRGHHGHRRSSSSSGSPAQEDFEAQTKGSASDKDGWRKGKKSGVFARGKSGLWSSIGSDSFDEVLGSQNLLKDVKGRSSPVSSIKESSSVKPERTLEECVSLKRVPSYSNNAASNLGTVKESSSFEPERRRVTILSLDGGGMRGLIAARVLAHLESLIQSKIGGEVRLCDYFDFLAGTSTGAIITMMISTPDEKGEPLFTGQGCCQFYARNGKNIFRPRWFDPWKGSFRQFYRPKYSPRRFESLLKGYLIRNGKALTMRDTLKPFLVTSFDISRATPHIFVRQAAMKDESRNFRLWEVCRGSASAPTYFKPAEVVSVDGKTKTTLIDGGAIQNNPSLVAMTHVLGNNEEFPEAVGLQDLLILSLGAGQLDEKFELHATKKWGMAGWVRPLMNIMMDGSSDTVDYQLAAGFAGHNCSEQYLRIQMSGLPHKTSIMDCATRANVQDLIQVTDDLLQEKAVMRNEYGEKVVHPETYAERLSWFADQLIAQKRLREQGGGPRDKIYGLHHGELGLGQPGPFPNVWASIHAPATASQRSEQTTANSQVIPVLGFDSNLVATLSN